MSGWIMTPTNLLGMHGRILHILMTAPLSNGNARVTEAVDISATTIAGQHQRKQRLAIRFFAENVQLPKLFVRAQLRLMMTLITGTVQWEQIAIHVALLPAVVFVDKQTNIGDPDASAGKDAYLRECPSRVGDAVRASQRNERSVEWTNKGQILDTITMEFKLESMLAPSDLMAVRERPNAIFVGARMIISAGPALILVQTSRLVSSLITIKSPSIEPGTPLTEPCRGCTVPTSRGVLVAKSWL
jgi:hypothetical protein